MLAHLKSEELFDKYSINEDRKSLNLNFVVFSNIHYLGNTTTVWIPLELVLEYWHCRDIKNNLEADGRQ